MVTFPGRMYAFVNFRSVQDAAAASAALQGRGVPELSGDRPLLLKYRPVRKAAAHLRALGLCSGDDGCSDADERCAIGGLALLLLDLSGEGAAGPDRACALFGP